MVVVVTLLCLGASHKIQKHNFKVKIEGIKAIPSSSQMAICIKFLPQGKGEQRGYIHERFGGGESWGMF